MTRVRLGPLLAATLIAMVMAGAVVTGCASSRLPHDGSQGARLFYSRCRTCHAPIDPSTRTASFWTEYLDKYAERARLKPAERDSVMAFVQRVAGQTAP